jgi:hypothetical protein
MAANIVAVAANASQPSADRLVPPYYDPAMAAHEALAHARFYPDEAAVRENAARRIAALEGLSVDDLRKMKRDDLPKFNDVIRRAGVSSYPEVERFFARDGFPIEALIGERGILVLNGAPERELFEERYVEDVPGVNATFAEPEAKKSDNGRGGRSEPLCFVVGGSGAGKTFFAMREELRTFRKPGGLRHSATVYVKPVNLDRDVPNFGDAAAPRRLVASIRRLIEEDVQNYIRPSWRWKKLDIHLCLVLDEAGARDLMGFFDQRGPVLELIKEAKTVLATSVVVVVCGTNISGTKFSSTEEAYFFRMKPWGKHDLITLLEKKKAGLRFKPGESAATVARAVFAQSTLAALATNARSAGFLVDAIEDGCARPSVTWMHHLSIATPVVVSHVVYKYAATNGLRGLKDEQRPRLAAWVLARLAAMKPRSTLLPEFDGLTVKEREVALSLLQINLEFSLDGDQLVVGALFPVSITPAIALVLFTLAGVPAGVLAGWRAEEEVAALYAVKEWLCRSWKEHSTALSAVQAKGKYGRDEGKLSEFEGRLRAEGKFEDYDLERFDLERDFGRELGKLRLFRLDQQVRTTKDGDKTVKIPLLSSASIAVNGDLARFADVLAPFMLVQARHTAKENVVVDLNEELDKCGLLRGGQDDRALRGLLAVWGGRFDDYFQQAEVSMMRASDEELPALERGAFELSRAFPANLIKSGRFEGPVKYLQIQPEEASDVEVDLKGGTVALPAVPDNVGVVFILASNAKTITLKLPGDVTFSVQEDYLDIDMQFDPTKMPTVEGWGKKKRRADRGASAVVVEEEVTPPAEEWEKFKATVRGGVTLKFLFTLHREKRQGTAAI